MLTKVNIENPVFHRPEALKTLSFPIIYTYHKQKPRTSSVGVDMG